MSLEILDINAGYNEYSKKLNELNVLENKLRSQFFNEIINELKKCENHEVIRPSGNMGYEEYFVCEDRHAAIAYVNFWSYLSTVQESSNNTIEVRFNLDTEKTSGSIFWNNGTEDIDDLQKILAFILEFGPKFDEPKPEFELEF